MRRDPAHPPSAGAPRSSLRLSSVGSAVASSLTSLRSSPLRTTLSTLGIVIGVAALVAVLALGDGVESFARRQVESTTSVQSVVAQPITQQVIDGVRVRRDPPLVVDAAALRSLASALGDIADVAGSASRSAWVQVAAAEVKRPAVLTAMFRGDPLRVPLLAGRHLSDADMTAGAHVAVISHRLAGALTKAPSDLVGRTILVDDVPLTVVGVTAAEASGAAPPPAVGVPLGAIADLPDATTIVATARRIEDVEATSARMQTWLKSRYGAVDGNFTVQSQVVRLRQVQQAMLVFKALMGSVTAISVLVGGIGVMNILLASVTERTREIGIRKATGARRSDILVQFLSESVTISGVGGALGLVSGYGIALLTAAIMRAFTEAPVHPSFSIASLAIVIVTAVFVGVAFGTYPALRAARLDPIEAIRHE